MSDYQSVKVEALDRPAAALTLRITEEHPDALCLGALLGRDGRLRRDKVGTLRHLVALILRDANLQDNGVDDALCEMDDPRAAAIVDTVELIDARALTEGPAREVPHELRVAATLRAPRLLRGIRKGARWGAAALPDGDL